MANGERLIGVRSERSLEGRESVESEFGGDDRETKERLVTSVAATKMQKRGIRNSRAGKVKK